MNKISFSIAENNPEGSIAASAKPGKGNQDKGFARFFGGFLLCFVLAFFGVTNALAAPTNAYQAQTVVTNWITSEANPMGAVIGTQILKVATVSDNSGQPLYFVVYLTNDYVSISGYVIVSGDDQAEPIIAFSSGNHFDTAADADSPLGALLSTDLSARIAAARQQYLSLSLALTVATSANQKWNLLLNNNVVMSYAGGTDMYAGLSGVSDIRVDGMVTSQWDQDYVNGLTCYNYYTPNNDVCGCVATAMSQLMRYYQYPTAGVGTASYSITVDKVVTTRALRGADGSGAVYHWSDMPLVPSSSVTLTQRQAVGSLTADAGVAAHMQYTSGESGANHYNATAALVGVFKYSNAVFGYNGEADIGMNLTKMINPNLDAGFPVMLGVVGNGGHSIVCDGYGYNYGTLYHHLNMGWSGQSTLWYALPNIGTSYNFTTVTSCIYNVFTSGAGEIISGRVLDSSGNPVSGATVTASYSGGTYTATTGAKGIYALKKLPASTAYTVSAAKSGMFFSSQLITTGSSKGSTITCGNIWGVDFTNGTGPNLAPYQPSTWSDSLVVATGTGTYLDSSKFCSADTLYVDWAAINNGSAGISTLFYSTLYVDGVAKQTWNTTSLNSGSYASVKDFSIGSLASGTHTLKMVVDSGGQIAESCETDNSYSKTIVVTDPVSELQSTLLSTGFETSEGFVATSGPPGKGWSSFYSAGMGIVASGIPGHGQSAYVGMSGTNFTDLHYEFDYVPQSSDIITLDTTVEFKAVHGQEMCAVEFWNQHFDRLLSIDFSRGRVGFFDDVHNLTNSDLTYQTDRAYHLQVTMDFGANLWTATLDGVAIFANRPIVTTSGNALNLGYLTFDGNDMPSPGGGYMLFDDVSVTKMSANSTPWTKRNSGATGSLMNTIYAHGLFVAAGDSGTILTSPDGVTWTKRTTGCSNTLYGVCFGNNTFITVGDSGAILTSPDGITWTRQTSNTSSYLYSAAYGNGKFVAVGASGTILTSPDGVTWASQNAGCSNYLFGVAYYSGFVAVGDTGTILTSTDGIAWTKQTSGTTSNLNGIAGGDSSFVAVGDGGTILFSRYYDKVTWTSKNSNTTETLWGVAYGGNGFTAVGDNGTVLTSDDETVWARYTPTCSEQLDSVAFGGSMLVAVGDAGTILTKGSLTSYTVSASASPSNAGTVAGAGSYISYTSGTVTAAPNYGYGFCNWTENGSVVASTPAYSFTVLANRNLVANFAASPLNPWIDESVAGLPSLLSICYANGAFWAAGSQGTIISSADGTAWSVKNSGTSANINSFAYGNGAYVAVGASGTILRSTDGTAWTGRTSGTSASLTSVAYGNSGFVAVGYAGTILSSPDGTNWTARVSGTSADILSVVYANSRYVATGSYGTILTSADGATWTSQASGTTDSIRSVTYGNNLFVGVGGYSGTILTSPDGTTWTSRTSGISSSSFVMLESVTYGNNLFVAVGSSGEYVTSADGISWKAFCTGGESLYGITYGNGTYTAVGVQGTILKTSPLGSVSYTVTATASPAKGGSVSGGGSYGSGATVSLTATPNSGYTFTNWTENGNVVSASANYSFTIAGNRTLVANFQALSATITVQASPANGGTVTGGGTYTVGSTQSISATANSGWTFTQWSDGNTQNPRTITVPAGGATYTANFVAQRYALTLSASPSNGGTISANPTPDADNKYASGTVVTLTGSAAAGYTFSSWSGDASGTANPVQVTMNGDKSVTANFSATGGEPSNWQTPTGMQNSMTVIAQVHLNGQALGTANGSVLAAFRNDSVCSGATEVIDGPLGKTFLLQVWANEATVSGMTLKLYDAATDKVYDISETLNFSAESVIGTMGAPQVYNIGSSLTISLVPNWNWISFNVLPLNGTTGSVDNSVAAVLNGYTACENDIIKSKNGQASYASGKWWATPGFVIDPNWMYKLMSGGSTSQQFAIRGLAVDPTSAIPLASGWNWIGYKPQAAQIVAAALKNLQATNNDLIKSQGSSQASFYGGTWYASPQNYQLSPGMGALLYVATAQNFAYQQAQGSSSSAYNESCEANASQSASGGAPSDWQTPSGIQNSMTVIAKVQMNGQAIGTTSGSVLAAFNNGVCTGTTGMIDGPTGKTYLLQVWSDQGTLNGMTLKLYDAATDKVYDITETLDFASDAIIGTMGAPQVYTVLSQRFALTAMSNPSLGGSVSASPKPDADGKYADGMDVTLSGSAASNFTFINWTENGTVVASSTTCVVTVSKSRTLVANFKASTLASWKSVFFTAEELQNPAICGDLAMPDKDGICNMLKYAFDLDRYAPDRSMLPRQGQEGENLTLTFERNKAATDLTYVVEVSNDLKTWNSGSGYTSESTVINDGANTQTLKVIDLTPVNDSKSHFIRLRVSRP